MYSCNAGCSESEHCKSENRMAEFPSILYPTCYSHVEVMLGGEGGGGGGDQTNKTQLL